VTDDVEPLRLVARWIREAERLEAVRLRKDLIDTSDDIVEMLSHVEQINDWSFGIYAGWLPIIVRLHKKVMTYAPDYKIVQVKEKFGSLRFYFDLPDDIDDAKAKIVRNLVTDTEKRSLTICDRCGKPGRLIRDNYYHRTRCYDHAV
jgi:hypothetical protein